MTCCLFRREPVGGVDFGMLAKMSMLGIVVVKSVLSMILSLKASACRMTVKQHKYR